MSPRWAECLGWWPERLASLLAVAGLLRAILPGFRFVRTWEVPSTDFKTVYAAAWDLARGVPAYDFPSIARIFELNHVIQPASWYAHAPVYPPFTLALLAPLTALPMVPAIYVWLILSGFLLACAIAALTRAAGELFGVPRIGRMVLIAAAAAFPLVSAGLIFGNVSVITGALCILAVLTPPTANRWLRAVYLAIALLLKPHLAIWTVIALLVTRQRSGRILAARACALVTAAIGIIAVFFTTLPDLTLQIPGYRTMLHAELFAGSMGATNRELVEVDAQITSLESLLGYRIHRIELLHLAYISALALLAAVLIWACRRISAADPRVRLRLIAAWYAFGLIATYHRAHDGVMLLILLPWILSLLRGSQSDALAWLVTGLVMALSIGPSFARYRLLEDRPGYHQVAHFLLYRQSPLAAAALCLLLIAHAVHEARLQPVLVRHRTPAMETVGA